MFEIQYDDREVREALQRLSSTAGNLRPALLEIGETLVASTKQRFSSQAGPDGIHWIDISEDWKETKRRRGNPTIILTDYGTLRDTINYQLQGNNTLLVGSPMEYAAIHQFGGTIKHKARTQTMRFKVDKNTGKSRFAKKSRANFEQDVHIGAHETNMPARPFLGVSDDDQEEIIAIVTRHIEQSLR